MKQCFQFLIFLMVGWNVLPAIAEVDGSTLIGQWCLVSQTINGKDLEKLSVKTLNEKLKAKPGKSYHFHNGKRVDVLFANKPAQTYSYTIAGSKNTRIRIKRRQPFERWQTFDVKSLTQSEIIATVYGTVDHRFTHGTCE